MLTIDSSTDMERALASLIPADLKKLLALRQSQTAGALADTARFIIVQPGDRAATVEVALGFSPTIDLDGAAAGEAGFTPFHEWCEHHPGWTEFVFVLSDDGPTHVLLVPDRNDIDPALLALRRDHA
jgi:hypothetical protein